ncbi:aspartate/glutamate racemase family protein [Lawsonibacter celer]|jgi:aspartate racemase|uniref:aspartate/glutamate racemase family protein n=1 Tax=Lawsonibacter celer TaxID=2986526 RepID=UPI001647C600|nr:aspartate/glutamate racemase family protein [Lawsonibacter celer]
MKTIGLIGGMSWESTLTYYQLINEHVKAALGGLHSAKILLYSVDFAEIEACQASGDWDRSAVLLTAAAQSLERAGADFLLICTNTMHKVAGQIQARVGIPLLHIAQATARALIEQGIRRAALLGTKYTMTQDFYQQALRQAGLEVLTPRGGDVELVNRVIYDELCLGVCREESRRAYQDVICGLAAEGAQAVILGCTEIGLLIRPEDSPLPVFDTARIHAAEAARLALEG